MMTKKIVLPVLIFSFASAAIFSAVTIAHAQTNSNNGFSKLVQAIAQKFNLDPNQVQDVFNQYHRQNMQNRQAFFQNRLDDLVTQGKITQSQKQAILDEVAKLKIESAISRQNRLSEIQSWAQSQGIDLSLIPMLGRGRGMGMKMGWMNTSK